MQGGALGYVGDLLLKDPPSSAAATSSRAVGAIPGPAAGRQRAPGRPSAWSMHGKRPRARRHIAVEALVLGQLADAPRQPVAGARRLGTPGSWCTTPRRRETPAISRMQQRSMKDWGKATGGPWGRATRQGPDFEPHRTIGAHATPTSSPGLESLRDRPVERRLTPTWQLGAGEKAPKELTRDERGDAKVVPRPGDQHRVVGRAGAAA